MQKLASNPNTANISKNSALRFLDSRSYDVDKALALIEADSVSLLLDHKIKPEITHFIKNWRNQMDISNLNISHVKEQMKTGKVN